MSVAPDRAGFEEAQNRKRAAFGQQVTFELPAVVTFPPGTPLDPETGTPYDPTVGPSSSSTPTASGACGVAFRTLRDEREKSGALGLEPTAHVIVIAGSGMRALASGAESFVLNATGERFKVVAERFDGLALRPTRWLVWGRQE